MMPHAGTARARLRPHTAATARRCSRCAAQELCKRLLGPPHAYAKGRPDCERSAGEVQRFVRVEPPSRGPGRGDQLPSWFADGVAAASGLPSGHDAGREKQPAGAQAAFSPATAAVVAAFRMAGAPSGRAGGARPCNVIGKAVGTASRSTSRTRRRAAFNHRMKPGCERGRRHQRKRFSGAATPCSTLPLRSRSARIRYALCTRHPFGRSDEPGHRRGDAHGPTCVWYQEQPLHRCRCVAPSHAAGVECTTCLARRRGQGRRKIRLQ
jgi:hypothetical protein